MTPPLSTTVCVGRAHGRWAGAVCLCRGKGMGQHSRRASAAACEHPHTASPPSLHALACVGTVPLVHVCLGPPVHSPSLCLRPEMHGQPRSSMSDPPQQTWGSGQGAACRAGEDTAPAVMVGAAPVPAWGIIPCQLSRQLSLPEEISGFAKGHGFLQLSPRAAVPGWAQGCD